MIERIQLILKFKNLSSSQFADEIKVQRSSVSHILTGRNKASLDFVTKILTSYPELNSEWLLFGKGQMIKKSETSITNEIPFEKSAKQNESIPEKKSENAKTVSQIETKSEVPSQKKNVTDNLDIKKIVVFFADNTYKEFIPGE